MYSNDIPASEKRFSFKKPLELGPLMKCVAPTALQIAIARLPSFAPSTPSSLDR